MELKEDISPDPTVSNKKGDTMYFETLNTANEALKAEDYKKAQQVLREYVEKHFRNGSEFEMFVEYIIAYKYHIDNAIVQAGMNNGKRAQEEVIEAFNIAGLMKTLIGSIQKEFPK